MQFSTVNEYSNWPSFFFSLCFLPLLPLWWLLPLRNLFGTGNTAFFFCWNLLFKPCLCHCANFNPETLVIVVTIAARWGSEGCSSNSFFLPTRICFRAPLCVCGLAPLLEIASMKKKKKRDPVTPWQYIFGRARLIANTPSDASEIQRFACNFSAWCVCVPFSTDQ